MVAEASNRPIPAVESEVAGVRPAQACSQEEGVHRTKVQGEVARPGNSEAWRVVGVAASGGLAVDLLAVVVDLVVVVVVAVMVVVVLGAGRELVEAPREMHLKNILKHWTTQRS